MGDAIERRPSERRAVRVGRVGRGEGERVERRRIGEGGERPQAVDGGGCRELRRTEPLDEITAARVTGILEPRQDPVRLREAARDALGLHTAARHDAVALEQHARRCGGTHGAVGARVGQERPASPHERRPRRRRRTPHGLHGLQRHAAEHPCSWRPPHGAVRLRPAAEEGPHGSERVVRDASRPGEVPEGVDDGLFARRSRHRDELRGEIGPARREGGEELLLERVGLRPLVPRRESERERVGGVQGDPSVASGQRAVPRPDHLARRGELVEHCGGVVGDARGQDERLPRTRRQRDAGELFDRRQHTVDALEGPPADRSGDVLPRRQEPGECLGRDRLDRSADRGERAQTQAAQHLAVAPLQVARVGTAARCLGGQEESARDAPLRLQPLQRLPRDGRADSQTAGDVRRAERAVRARVAGDEVGERVDDGFEERDRDADGQRDPEGVAQAPRVLDLRGAALARDRHADRPARRHELVEQRRRRGAVGRCSGGGVRAGRPLGAGRALEPQRDLVGAQRAEQAQQVRDPLDAAHPSVGGETLRLGFELRDDGGVEELSHLDLAEQLAQQCRVDRQGGRAALGQRGIALVHERADISEQQVAREG